MATFKNSINLPPLNRTVQAPTSQGYEAFAKRKGVTPETVNLPHDAKGHWIGDKNAKNVVIYYHSKLHQRSEAS